MTRISLLLLVLGLDVASALAAPATYEALRAARPDGRTVPISNLVLERDAFRFTFQSGAMHFLAPVEGRTFGAVFVGQGSYELRPATEGERRQLNLVTRRTDLEVLNDTFEQLVLLFGDGTEKELEKHAAVVQQAGPRATAVYEEHLRRQKNDYQINLHLRVLQDLLNGWGESKGVFLAAFDGATHPPALAIVDPWGIGNLGGGFNFLGGEETGLIVADEEDGGVWYLSARHGEAKNGRGKAHKPLGDALHYSVDTTISDKNEISGTTVFRFHPLVDKLRVIPLTLMPKLRIRSASVAKEAGTPEWQAAEFVQEEIDLSQFQKMFRDERADANAGIVLPSPVAKGEPVLLKITYEGKEVLRDAGDKNYYVGARESWYPNLGAFTDVATYELTFRTRKDRDLVSVGVAAGETIDGDRKISKWKSDSPMRVAGFNYGKFRKVEREDKDSGVKVTVYTNPGTPDIIHEINEAMGSSSVPGEEGGMIAGGSGVKIDTTRLAESALVDAINTARVGNLFFGRIPYDSVSITQQSQWSFGQSWPSLIYLPYVAFIDSTTRAKLFGGAKGLSLTDVSRSLDALGPHEFGHQWWGHQVGWESYRDQWLSEGFAQFTAALVIQQTMSGKRHTDFWERERKTILDQKPGSIANWEAGPITQGHRLGTRRNPTAGFAMIYSKGAFVLHMLRGMMRDTSSNAPDQAFIKMMRDFVSTYAMKNPSTADFQKIVEKHLGGDMSWFFDQWVYGTEIPTLTSNLQIREAGGGKYKLSGTVTQAGVSKNFRVMVPIYLEFGKDQIAQVGKVPLVGPSTYDVNVELPLPKKPRRALINALYDVLAR